MTTRTSTAATDARPTFRELTDEECRALLARHNVGRIAYSFHDRVDIQPIHYQVSGAWLYGRTSRGGKFMTLAHNAMETGSFVDRCPVANRPSRIPRSGSWDRLAC